MTKQKAYQSFGWLFAVACILILSADVVFLIIVFTHFILKLFQNG